MADVKITDEIRDVLERCHYGDSAIKLPDKLDRRLYEQVNTVLMFAGAKWSKTHKLHICQGDARSTIDRYLADGKAPDEKKAFQSFYTPQDYADELVQLANVEGKWVLEPSAGGGALVKACIQRRCLGIRLIEIRPEAVLELRLKGYYVECDDFMKVAPKCDYDCVVMNPPFSNNQDCHHVAHALRFLKPGGRLVAVMAGNKSRQKLQNLKARVMYDGHDWIERDVEQDRFKESGTGVATFTLVINKKNE